MPLLPSPEHGGEQSQKMIAKAGADAMGKIGYDAIGVGAIDFSLGTEFLKKTARGAGFGFVTTNLFYRDGMQPFGSKYAILNAGDIRVGILSILPVDAFDEISDRKLVAGLEIIPPEAAIQAVLPEIKEKTDIVILLSQFTQEKTRLLKSLDNIDLSISCGDKKSSGGCSAEDEFSAGTDGGNSPVVIASHRGQRLGYARLDFGKGRQPAMSQGKMIRLDDSVLSDGEIVKITGVDMFDKFNEEKEKEELERIKKLHKLSPVEYLEMLKKQKAAGGEKK